VYRSLLRLYPRSFRRRYAEDLVQHFVDLAHERGQRAAWGRTGLDLLVTVPRYRLESIMSEEHSATALTVAIVGLAAAGVLSVLIGAYPGAVLLGGSAILAFTQRSALARAIRTPDRDRRRRRFTIAAVLAVVFAASIVSYVHDISDEHVGGTSLVIHNAIGVPAMLGALGFFLAGLLTPRGPKDQVRRQPVT
jgi:hypothetical protein